MTQKDLEKINKKGQITLFAIIGIIILIAGAVFFIISDITRKQELETAITKTIPVQLQEQQQIKSWVDSCISDIVPEGLEIMRLQGGYINIPLNVKTLEVDDDILIYEDNGKHVKKQKGKNKVPYYITANSLDLPSLEFLENELAQYVNEQLAICVGDFEPFKEQGIGITYGTINTTVGMGKVVFVMVDFPIQGIKQDIVFNLNKFAYSVPIDIKKIYNYAKDLVLYELYYTYLENHAKQLISLYQYQGGTKGKNDLPPISYTDVNTDCKQVSWQTDEVEQSLKNIFSKNYLHLKIANTNFERIQKSDPIAQGVYDSFIRNYFDEDKDIHIDFLYNPLWPMDFDISPKLGSTIKPDRSVQSRIPFLSMFCTLKYAFKYHLKMPILVGITDNWSAHIDAPSLITGNSFTFRFVMEQFLCGNQNRICTGKPEYTNYINLSTFGADILPETRFCENKDSEEITINVFDSENNQSVKDVDINYYCGSYRNDCFIGRTNENGVFKSKFPFCINGVVYLQKLNYSPTIETLTVHDNDEHTYDYYIEPLRKYELKVYGIHLPTFVKHYYLSNGFTTDSCNGQTKEELFTSTAYRILENVDVNDQIIIILTNNLRNLNQPVINYPAMDSIIIGSGTYDVNMVFNSKVRIRPSTYDVEDGDDVVVDFDDDASKHSAYEGLWNLGNTKYEWDLKRNELLGKDTITFYALIEHLPIENLEVKSFSSPIMKNDSSLSKQIKVDKDCNGEFEEVTVNIPFESYYQFIRPKLE